MIIFAKAILVVEDDADSREMLVEYLQFKGYTVHAAPDGATALDLADAFHPRVILMDLSMPNLDGLETTRQLKAHTRTSNAAIVAVTGHVFAADRDAARRAGCDYFVAKPYDLNALTILVAGLIATQPQAAGRLPLNFAPQSRTP